MKKKIKGAKVYSMGQIQYITCPKCKVLILVLEDMKVKKVIEKWKKQK